MNVHGVRPTMPSQAPEPTGRLAEAPSVQPQASEDVIEISTAGRLAARVAELPEVRADLVARVKAEIENGTYETAERIEITADRLADELFGEL
ncbi:MAG: flagellar biosynthesis anti-sigma factor FlgM [Phycisphaerae bacterium]|nr:flagellar biosynthesis anti-sigma factor FlgM [Phycisphaerae bacterium]